MLVSNLFENNPQENGMAVLKQLANAVRDRADIDLEVGNELLPIKYYQANHLVSRWKALASSRQQNQALASFGDINWINDVLDAVDAKMAAGAKVGSVEGGRDVDEGRTQMYSDGDRVKLNSTYANSDNPNEIYTVAQCDQDRKRCWIGDKSGSGWYVTFDQIIPAISSDTEGQGRPYWSRIHDSSLKETSTIDGKTEDPGALRWKQTSMSYEAAVNKYGADHVRKEGKNRAGQEVIAVHVPLGEQAVSLGNSDEYNDESGMAYNSLRTIHRATKGLANTIKDGDNLPEWCQEKISLAEDYLVTVWDYLQSEKGVAEGLTQTLRKFDPTIKARIRSKSQDQTNQGIDTIQHLADLDLTSDDMVSRAMKPNTYFRNAERYAKLANKDVAEGETTLTKTGRIHRSTDAYGGSPPEPDPIGDELDKSGTSRIDRALGVRFKTKGYQKDTNTVSEAPGDKGSSREHLAGLRAEQEKRKQNQAATVATADRNLKNYQAGRVRASDIKVAEGSEESTPGDEHTRRQKLIKYLAKHKGWDHSDLEHATTPELIQYYKECRQGMAEGYQLNEGIMDSLNGIINKIKMTPGIQKFIGAAKAKQDQLIQALQHSANGKDLVANIQQAVGGQQAVAEGWGEKIGGAVAASAGGGLLAGAADIMMRAYIAMGKPDIATMWADKAWDASQLAPGTAGGQNVMLLVSMLVVLGALAMLAGGYQVKKGMAEARSVDDLKDELTSWKKEGPWKKTTTKDPRGKAPNLSDRARRETEKMSKELNPTTKKV